MNFSSHFQTKCVINIFLSETHGRYISKFYMQVGEYLVISNAVKFC